MIFVFFLFVTAASIEEVLGEAFTLNDAFDINFKPRNFKVDWIDGKFLYGFSLPFIFIYPKLYI